MPQPGLRNSVLIGVAALLVAWILVTAIAAWSKPDQEHYLPGTLLAVSILALTLGVSWKFGDDLLYFFVALALIGFGGFAWLSQHPDSVWLEKAQSWPVVGELATRFRTAYLGRERTEEQAPEVLTAEIDTPVIEPRQPVDPGPEPPQQRQKPPTTIEQEASEPLTPAPTLITARETEPPRPAVPTTPAARAPPSLPKTPIQLMPEEWSWCLPGNRILASAGLDGEVIAQLGALSYLPVFNRVNQWAQVRYHDRQGWIDTQWQPPHKRRKAHRGVLRHQAEPVQSSDWSNIRTARKILGIKKSDLKVGAYKLFTDVDDQELLTLLDGAATAAEQAYFARYARLPSGNPLRSAILFAEEADYRLFSEKTSDPLMTSRSGHASRGVLAFYAEGQSHESLARTLVHEIAHLLNSRAIAWDLAPWLEEGIASDLGSIWFESSPDIQISPGVGGSRRLELQGFESRILTLAKLLETGNLPLLRTVVRFDRETFYRDDVAMYSYAQSAALIRYLLDGKEGRLADGFRVFLRHIAAGRNASLLESLEIEEEELNEGFKNWLVAEAQASMERLQRRAEILNGR